MQDVKASELEKINKPKASDDDMIPDEFPTEESDDAAHAAVMGHVLNLVPDKQRQAVREESLRFKERQNPIHRPRYDHMFSYHFYFILLILRTHPRIHINCIWYQGCARVRRRRRRHIRDFTVVCGDDNNHKDDDEEDNDCGGLVLG
jgi:hypothetical protein